MARSDSQPAACSSLIVGARSTALLGARSCTVLLSRVAVVLLAASFPGQPEAKLRALVHRYIEEATTWQWSMMAELTATRK
jgi:hypothetical protein